MGLTGCGGPYTCAPETLCLKPYKIKGKWYYPQKHYELEEEGIASHYGGKDGCHGEPTANGEIFDMHALTAAHPTLPLPCIVWIENLENGKTLKVRINDRGPYKNDRIIDVSVQAAKLLGFYKKGLAKVRIKTLVEESLALPQNDPYNRDKPITHRLMLNNLSLYVDHVLEKNKLCASHKN